MIEILTPRFRLRELTLDDVGERYLAWLADPVSVRFITAAAQTRGLEDLRVYVRERIGRTDVLFLGIFDRATGLHVGNVKYEPVDSERGFAIMGILIGEPAYRGKGASREVLEASARWLGEHRGIREILLGVAEDNVSAIRAYEAVGFTIESTPYIPAHAGAVTMVRHQ